MSLGICVSPQISPSAGTNAYNTTCLLYMHILASLIARLTSIVCVCLCVHVCVCGEGGDSTPSKSIHVSNLEHIQVCVCVCV